VGAPGAGSQDDREVLPSPRPAGLPKIKLVSCDDADWITRPVTGHCPNATVCLDAFHIVKAGTDALDKVRREVWNDARRHGQTQLARELKGARSALWKNPENLTEPQQLKLARIQKLNHRLYRAYLLCQQLRQIYRVAADPALVLLDAWQKWARRCRPSRSSRSPVGSPAASNDRGGDHQQALRMLLQPRPTRRSAGPAGV
jgi:transposase